MFGFKKTPVFEVTLGFKSGRTVVVKCTKFNLKKNGDELTNLEWALHKSNKFTQLLSIRLDEVEFISSKQI